MAARELLLGLNRNSLAALAKMLMFVISGAVSGGPRNMKILREASCTDLNFIVTGKKPSINETLCFNCSRQK